jgi:hypothetical protein
MTFPLTNAYLMPRGLFEGIMSTYFKNDYNTTENEEDKEHKVIELYKKLNWNYSEVDELIIIIKFYEALRHSIAHNIGIPSNKVIKISTDKGFIKAIENWKTKFPKRKISPPPIIIQEKIKLKPHHSILYSETCRRIANDINIRLYKELGEDYFIQKIIKKHLIDKNRLTEPQCKNATRYLVYHLNKDYNININTYDDIYNHLADEELKKIKNRYLTLKNYSQKQVGRNIN